MLGVSIMIIPLYSNFFNLRYIETFFWLKLINIYFEFKISYIFVVKISLLTFFFLRILCILRFIIM